MTEPLGAGQRQDLDPRTAELEQRLAAVRKRIAAAAAGAGRGGRLPALIVVTKFHPAEDIRRLAGLGVRDVGENRDQEAAAKALELADLPLTWHFVGQLQTKKAKSVARYAAAVHSVDRPQLVEALAKAVRVGIESTGRAPLDCFIQVSLEEDAGTNRGGAAPADVPALAEQIAGSTGLNLAGVMAVAPLGAPPEPAFEKLAGISALLVATHPGATAISAGMSQDLEAAIKFGATHLRIGSDILGSRPAVG
ncbi:YggS family pyridoxal phosphate-dependent enzyme [Pseudarthrobacter phenanthrenivorans]|uniref:Pyridoxal phosphate homeostasis protein n=1 Tax=Pseudarthrobacter phenanthrenivorans TaxID=361575 RepID=A0A0B4EI70_PSEPS|nr:YggS family pyridoxal phosphate-dependent enzyme [Pseudarthrobacter phenanthrenivorans]KIC66328.1 alanine racemase [Pseudarthrobacter phenanthrenivorans]